MMTVNNILIEENRFDEGCFDLLLVTLKDSFENYFLNNGVLNYDDLYKDEPEPIQELLKLGFDYIEAGIEPSAGRILLEYQLIKIFTFHEVSQEEIMKLILIKELIPLIQQCMVDEFIALATNFCSDHTHEEIYKLRKLR